MNLDRDGGLVALFVGLFLVAVVLAAAETALVRVSRVRIATRAEEGSRRAIRALGLLDDLPRVLNTILLVVLLVQIGAATITGVLAERWFGSVGVTIATFVLTVLLFVYSEAIPKTYAYRNAAPVVITLAYPVGTLTALLRPLVSVLVRFADLHAPGKGIATTPTVTERELRSLAAAAATEGEITGADLQLIDGAFRLGDRVAEEVMVPRVDIVSVPGDATAGVAMATALASGHRRLPVHGEGLDDIVGIVRTRDLASSPAKVVRDMVYPPLVVAESKRVVDLLREMQAGGIHVAIVVDEHGGTAGMVTIEDIVEELFGVISEEGELPIALVQQTGDRTWLADGRVLIDDLVAEIGMNLPEGDWTTLGGLVMGLGGDLPRVGQEYEAGGVRLRVIAMRGRRIRSVAVSTGLID